MVDYLLFLVNEELLSNFTYSHLVLNINTTENFQNFI